MYSILFNIYSNFSNSDFSSVFFVAFLVVFATDRVATNFDSTIAIKGQRTTMVSTSDLGVKTDGNQTTRGIQINDSNFIVGKGAYIDSTNTIKENTNRLDKNGHLIYADTDTEVDFVANKSGKIYYIQVALAIPNEEKKEQEYKSIRNIPDSFKKIIVVKEEGKHYYTNFSGKGKGHFSKVIDMKIDPALFPDVSVCRPIAVIRVDPFDITFPEAKIGNIVFDPEKAR